MRSKAVRGVVIRIPASRAAQSAGNGLFQFPVFSRLPLGGRLLAKQGGEGCRYLQHGKQSGEQMRTDRGLFQFSVFSWLPLGGRLLAKQGGEGRRYPHPGKQSGEQLQHLLSPLGRVANESEPREVCLNSPSFRGFPLGGGSLRSKVVRGVVIHTPASRAASNREPREVCLKLIPPPACLQKIHFFKPFKMQKKYLQ